MAGTYGGAGYNFFTVPSNLPQVSNQQYYVVVNSTSGVSQIYRHARTGDVTVGTINPKTNSFTKSDYATYSEIQEFNKKNTINTVKNNSVLTAKKGILSASNGRLTSQQAQSQAENLIRPNTAQSTKSPPQRPAAAPKAGKPPAAAPAEAPAAGGAAPAAAGGEGSTTPVKVDEKNWLQPSNLGKEGYLKYPTDMRDDQDTIAFTVLEIAKTNLSTDKTKVRVAGNGFSMAYQPATEKGGLKTVSTVILPIQPSISDFNSVDWTSGNINPFEQSFSNYTLGLQQAAIKTEADGETKRFLDFFKGQQGELGTLAHVWAAEQAVGVQGLMSRATGQVLNPNLELLFNGPALRPFNFVFKLSPRSEKEATDVRKIIRFFKENMAVRKSNTELFVKSPYVFRVMYNHPIKPTKDNPTPERTFHKSINRVKTCALQSFNVDYTPLGSYMTYEDEAASMVSYNISLQFTEIEPVYSTDYVMSEDEIGY